MCDFHTKARAKMSPNKVHKKVSPIIVILLKMMGLTVFIIFQTLKFLSIPYLFTYFGDMPLFARFSLLLF